MSPFELQRMPDQQVCDFELPGHTTRYLNLPFLASAIPTHVQVLSIRHQMITVAVDGGLTTWFHHEPERLRAAAHNWPDGWGWLPGSGILFAQAAPDDDYGGQTFFFTCSDQPLSPCTLRPFVRPGRSRPHRTD